MFGRRLSKRGERTKRLTKFQSIESKLWCVNVILGTNGILSTSLPATREEYQPGKAGIFGCKVKGQSLKAQLLGQLAQI